MRWQPEIGELQRRHAMSREPAGTERAQPQLDAGKLTIRERIEALLDPDSFQEIGGLAVRDGIRR